MIRLLHLKCKSLPKLKQASLKAKIFNNISSNKVSASVRVVVLSYCRCVVKDVEIVIAGENYICFSCKVFRSR